MNKEQELINELQEYLDIEDTGNIALYPEEVQMCIDALEEQMVNKGGIVITLWMDEMYIDLADKKMLDDVKDAIEYATYNYTVVQPDKIRINETGEQRYNAIYQIVNEFDNVRVR